MVKIITVDGPSGAGKGTVSRILAKQLGFHYLDSGALYRLLGLVAVRHGIEVGPSSDLTHLAKTRPGLVPVLGDARKHSAWGVLVPRKVDWLFQDVAQSGQVDIFISAFKRLLNIGGIGLLSLKAASDRWTGEDEQHLFKSVEEKLSENGFEIEESIELTGYEDNHVLFVARRIE